MSTLTQIQDALKARIDKVCVAQGIPAKTHTFFRYTDETHTGTKNKELFQVNGKFHTWLLTRNPPSPLWIKGPEDDLWAKRHPIELRGYYALDDKGQSELVFQKLTDALMEDFRTGDRTLGGKCNTMGMPAPVETGSGHAVFMGVLCHELFCAFDVEEIYRVAVTREVYRPEVTGHRHPLAELADGLIEAIRPQVVGTVVPSASRVQLATSQFDPLVHPLDPDALPRILVRIVDNSAKPVNWRAGTVSEFSLKVTFWYQAQQTVGQDHQGRLAYAVSQIAKPFLGNFDPGTIQSIPRIEVPYTVPVVQTLYDNIPHDLDDPNRAVQVGGVQMLLNGRTRQT